MLRKMHRGFQWGNLEEKNAWEDLRIDDRILKCTLIRWGEGVHWPRIGTAGGLL